MRWSLILLVLTGCVAGRPSDQPVPVSFATDSSRVMRPVRSWKAIRNQNIVTQSFDYSCGAAAMATLLRYYFNETEASEQAVLGDMIQQLTKVEKKEVEAEGFSLLDLKHYAERHHYNAIGVTIKLSDLPKLRAPVLVFLELAGSKHFAVVRGVRGDLVYLADPARGNIKMRYDRFAEEWPSGIAFVLDKPGFGLRTDSPLAVGNDLHPERDIEREGLYALP